MINLVPGSPLDPWLSSLIVQRTVSGGSDATISFLDAAADTSSQTEYTFSSKSLGTANADRHIIVFVATRSTVTISTVTIGGVSATDTGVTDTTGASNGVFFIASVPTGTTGDFVVTPSSSATRCGIIWWETHGLASATVHDSAVGTETMTLDVPAGGVVISAGHGTSTPTIAFTNVTEDHEGVVESDIVQAGGSEAYASLQTNLGVIQEYTSGANIVRITASWS